MSYHEEVLADAPYGYWRLGETTDVQPNLGSAPLGEPVTLATGVTRNIPGALNPTVDDGACSFDGIDDYGSVIMDLTDTWTLTVEFCLRWDVDDVDDDFAMEYSNNANGIAGTFFFDWNASFLPGTVGVKLNMGGGSTDYYIFTFPKPTVAVWHHIVVVMVRSDPPAVRVWVDGSVVEVTPYLSDGDVNDPFALEVLYLMSRAGTGLFGAGSLDELAIYKTELSSERVVAHYQALEIVGNRLKRIAK